MKKIFLTRRIYPEAMELLEKNAKIEVWSADMPITEAQLIEKVAQVEGLISMLSNPITEKVLQSGAAHSLRVVSQMAVGYDNIAVEQATKLGIAVGNTPGVLTETTADLAWALLMAAARRVVEGHTEVHRGIWRSWGPDVLCGTDVYGATLGIIGFGRIGQAVAARAAGFHMKVLYTQRHRDLAAEERTQAQYMTLDELLRQADFVTLHAYLSAETRGMIGKEQLAHMKPGAILINTARGAMIDQAALYEALSAGHLAAAALDVTDPEPIPQNSPLLELPQVIITPHIGSASTQTRRRMSVMTAENVLAGVAREKLPYCVNPEVYAQRK
ncbi:MAG: D-glycerate dehydrogenase [Anaerolineaceae bacterium]|nr:D-glycerate dehydrogenase [Anaerolineaceae bacterium]